MRDRGRQGLRAQGSRDPRVALVGPSESARGPIPRLLFLLQDGLTTIGWEVTVARWGRGGGARWSVTATRRAALDLARVRRRVREQGSQIVVVHASLESRSLLRTLVVLIALRWRVDVLVVQFHGGRSDLLAADGNRGLRMATAALCRLSDGLLVLSTEEQRDLAGFWPQGRVLTVMNPFMPGPEWSIVRSNAAAGDPKTPEVVLFVGRLIVEKGISEVLEALSKLAETNDARLIIAGEGPDRLRLEEYARRLGIEPRTTFAGYLSRESLAEAYEAASIFVLPTRYREGFPTSITEAMFAGLPIITTRTRGLADHLVDGVNAIFVEPGDADGLAVAIQTLLGNRPLRERMGKANRVKVEQFATEIVAAGYADALKEIIKPRQAPGKAKTP